MENRKEKKPVSAAQSIGVWVVLALISIGSFFLAFTLMSGGGRPPAPDQPAGQTSLSCMAVLVLMLSIISLLMAAAGYATVLATSCLTFTFTKPVWNSGLKARLYIANIIVSTLLLLGIGGAAAGVAGPLLGVATGGKLPMNVALMIPFLALFIPGQLLVAWSNIWKPLVCGLIRKRLLSEGLSPDEMESGMYAGISDPSKSSMKKFSLIEDDLGMLWLIDGTIRYKGDSQAFEIDRSQVTAVERTVDKGSIAAYAGAVHIIIRWRDGVGQDRMVRLHLEDYWTLSSLARKLDGLGTALEQWQRGNVPADGSEMGN